MDRNQKEQGSMAIEAIISLTFFAFTFLALVSMITYARVQLTIQDKLNSVAKEMSQYYYIVDMVGAADAMDGIGESAAKGKEKMDDTVTAFSSLFSSLQETGEKASGALQNPGGLDKATIDSVMESVKNSAENNVEAMGTLRGNIKDLAQDPMSTLKMMASIAAEGMADKFASEATGYLAEALFPRYFALEEAELSQRLTAMGVEGGLGGICFNQSTFDFDTRTINIVVHYQLRDLTPIPFLGDRVVCQVASTRAWIHAK